MMLFLLSLLISSSSGTLCVVQKQYRDAGCTQPRNVEWIKVFDADCMGTESANGFVQFYNKAVCSEDQSQVRIYNGCTDNACSEGPPGTEYCAPTKRDTNICEESSAYQPGGWDSFFTIFYDKWSCEVCEELSCENQFVGHESICTKYQGVAQVDPLLNHRQNVNNDNEEEESKQRGIRSTIVILSVALSALFLIILIYFRLKIRLDNKTKNEDIGLEVIPKNAVASEDKKLTCIIVGNWDYSDVTGCSVLMEPEENVKTMKNMFVNSVGCNVVTKCNTDVHALKTFVSESLRDVKSGPILFYYTGHVTESESGHDKSDRLSIIGTDGIELNLRELINEFLGMDKIIIIDSYCTLQQREMFSETKLSIDSDAVVKEGNSFYALSFRLGTDEKGDLEGAKCSVFTQNIHTNFPNLETNYGSDITSLVHDCANEFGEIIQHGEYVHYYTQSRWE